MSGHAGEDLRLPVPVGTIIKDSETGRLLADFTEPDAENDGHRHLRSKVIGVCAPAPDANVVLLGDIAFLELPAAHYPLEVDDVYERVVKHSAIFVGPVELVRKNVYRALPGGRLQVQLSL